MMKVTCNHCGAKNDLGRIFCLACGKRMQITNADVQDAQSRHHAFKMASLLQPVLASLIIIVAGLIAWPKSPVADVQAERLAVRSRVATKVGHLAAAAGAKREAVASFDAEEINAYLKARAAQSGADREPLSVWIDKGLLMVLQESKLGPFPVGGKSVGPIRFTREVALLPAGRIFLVRGASLGHLPLPGPLAGPVSGPVLRSFSLLAAEQKIERQLTGMTIEDGKLEITVGP